MRDASIQKPACDAIFHSTKQFWWVIWLGINDFPPKIQFNIKLWHKSHEQLEFQINDFTLSQISHSLWLFLRFFCHSPKRRAWRRVNGQKTGRATVNMRWSRSFLCFGYKISFQIFVRNLFMNLNLSHRRRCHWHYLRASETKRYVW